MFGLQMNLGMGNFRSKLKALFAHLFTNKTTTIDGVRYLVNEGEGENAVMHTGQGVYFNGVDNYIDTGVSYNDKFSLLTTFTVPSSDSFVIGGNSSNFIYCKTSTDEIGLKFLGGALVYLDAGVLTAGDTVTLLVKFEKTATEKTFTINIGETVSTATVADTLEVSASCVLGARDIGAVFFTGVIQNTYVIPDYLLTNADYQTHYNKPEQTLYWDNGVLKSDILDQATIDSMQAGNGFWYPMTENVSAGGYRRNHALAMPSNKVSDDFSTWTQPSGNWTINADGSATMGFTDSWTPLVEVIEPFSVQAYVVEIKLSAVSGEVRLVEIDSGGGVGNIASNISTNGTFRYIYTPADLSKDGIALGRQFGSDGGGCTIDNIKVYPLENSGLTPLVNWTTTTSTNASQLTTGYQCALVEQDIFGLPINPVTIDVKADSLADAQAQFLAENGLTLTDNAGTLELYK